LYSVSFVIVIVHWGEGLGDWCFSCSTSYGSSIYNYLCNQCLSPLTLWVQIPFMRGMHDTILCDDVCQWLAEGRCFSTRTPVSFTNKTDRQDIIEILLKVALNIYTLAQKIVRNQKIQWQKEKKRQTDKRWSTQYYIKRLSNTNPTKTWSGVNSGAPEGSAANSTLVVHVVLIRLPGKRIYISFLKLVFESL
jgi:hypothetical protein